jgi:hypothetical protein
LHGLAILVNLFPRYERPSRAQIGFFGSISSGSFPKLLTPPFFVRVRDEFFLQKKSFRGGIFFDGVTKWLTPNVFWRIPGFSGKLSRFARIHY